MLGREKLLLKLKSKLFGPGLGNPDDNNNYDHEIIDGRMDLSYLVGILYPQEYENIDNTDYNREENDDGEFGNVDPDDPLNVAEERMPSSLGFSVCLTKNSIVKVKISAARYISFKDENEKEIKSEQGELDKESNIKKNKQKSFKWKRHPLGPEERDLSISKIFDGQNKFSSETPEIQKEKPFLEDSILLVPFVRKISDEKNLVTFSLVNNLKAKKSDKVSKTENTLFQLEFSISIMEGEILKYPSSSHFLPVTDEEREMRLMYDNKRPYAVGHGVSVDWTINKNNSCEKVSITFIPKSHVMKPQFDDVSYSISGKEVPKLYSNNIFKLSYLSSNKLLKEELIKNLKGITNYYHGWIEELEKQNVENIYHDEKRRIIDRCSKSKLRIEEGISLLNDDQIFEIFKLSNEVMLYSMLQSEKLKNGPFELDNEIDEVKLDKETKVWRPFQLAFFLQVLPSLINENHNDRDLVDLIWFPTGGGKTEAYLFLAAFELIRRRYVYGEKGNGVGIINRYTYRFLSMDQFQRTSIMICALETIRKKIFQVNEKIGKEEFSIGLFVGEAISPNNLEPNPLFSERDKSSLTQLESLYKERDPRERNPFPISSCPSCGTFLLPKKTMKMMDGSVDVGAYGFKQNKRQFKTHCLNKKCEFHDKLPIYFIDEDITKNRPSFLLGTIDKFAVIPWDTASQQIFSAKNNSKYFPPSLIIQDELHLISGPLGTISSIYEAAFEILMSKSNFKEIPFEKGPKYIASTATIRNSSMQIKRMYGKKTAIFPSPGLQDNDSFFTKLDDSLSTSRLYCGLMGQGQSPTVSVSWITAAILQSVYELSVEKENDGKPKLTNEEVDNLWTILGYFNSKREFGRITHAITDEIPTRAKIYATKAEGHEERNKGIFKTIELKSNSSTPIALARERLNKKHTKDEPSFDYAASTNIISVGVDIQRLGLMLVNGQPKLSSEYIQATSRVGRGRIGGLVITSYSLTKSRDRSHYETFKNYHECFYSFVEPTSVTPGSIPALERSLHASMISLIRHRTKFSDVKKVSEFDKNDAEVVDVINLFRSRLLKCYDDEKEVQKRINQFIDDRLDAWHLWAKNNPSLSYKGKKNEKKPHLLYDFDDKILDGVGWHTLRSMRFVDKELELGR